MDEAIIQELKDDLEINTKVISELKQMLLKYRAKLKATNGALFDMTGILIEIQDIIIGTDIITTSNDAIKLIDNILIEHCPYLLREGLDRKNEED